MQKYRQKSTIIEAVQFNPEQQPWPEGVVAWKGGPSHGDESYGYITTPTGREHVHAGDWIVRGESGTLHICKDVLFQGTYEPVEEKPFTKSHVMKRAVVDNKTFNRFGREYSLD
jgi:hypothetical protein